MLKPLLGALALFDLVLGGVALASPDLFSDLLWHASPPEDWALIRRTGVLWLFFSLAEMVAWRDPGDPKKLRFVALLRWMDVPADAVWWWFAEGFSRLGQIGIGVAPIFNLLLGIFFWREAKKKVSRER